MQSFSVETDPSNASVFPASFSLYSCTGHLPTCPTETQGIMPKGNYKPVCGVLLKSGAAQLLWAGGAPWSAVGVAGSVGDAVLMLLCINTLPKKTPTRVHKTRRAAKAWLLPTTDAGSRLNRVHSRLREMENRKSVSHRFRIQLKERRCIHDPGRMKLFVKLRVCMWAEMSQFHSGLICRDFSEHKYLQKKQKSSGCACCPVPGWWT